jgi:hypothetical protein
MKLSHALEALSSGAVLHLSLADKPTWKLNDGATEVTINSRAVQTMIKRGNIAGAGDSLFSDIPSQTWRHPRPKIAPQKKRALNWKTRREGLYVACASRLSGGQYFIRRRIEGYEIEFHAANSVSNVNVNRVYKLEDAKTLAELHHDKRKELILKYGDKRNVPREVWSQFRRELLAWQEALPKNSTLIVAVRAS